MLDVRSSFLYHAPCTACGSKDNVAVYSSGSAYCFGCGWFTRSYSAIQPAARSPILHQNVSGKSTSDTTIRSYPDDINHQYPGVVIKWIEKYNLLPEDLIRNNIVWSPRREQLIFTFYGEGKDVVLWQARNFKQGTTHKHRFFTCGSPENVIAKYHQSEKERTTCVLVEDCISGLKVSYGGVDGVPCFSSSVSREKLARLSRLYDKMIVWLDSDKYSSAQKIAVQGASLGMTTRVVYTELDPKCYSIDEIQENIKL
jgi:hypothetical protein